MNPTPGISRIDHPKNWTHGFFVRVWWQGQIFSSFFADKKYGGRPQALAVSQEFRLRLRKKLGMPDQLPRQRLAENVGRQGKSGIRGVQRVIDRRVKPWRKYWLAKWSPELGVVKKKQFSIHEHGEEKAKLLAIRARRAGVRSMI
jgi:hypothetical protein